MEYEIPPRELFSLGCRYLAVAGWFRDGDDPGLWSSAEVEGSWLTFGEALMVQLELDGVAMTEGG